ncbi:MAG: hypothetical protein LBN21_00830, partial [Treponema sp.]|nr:hypothetical protein [Treponema sp.]
MLLSKFAPAVSGGESQVITGDRKLNPTVWDSANSSPITNYLSTTGGPPTGSYSTAGTLKSVWDGYTLYLGVTVLDNTPSNLTALENSTQRLTSPGTGAWNQFDAVGFNIDFMDDKFDKWSLDDGFIKVSRSGKLASGRMNDSGNDTGTGDETWADPFGQPEAREFTDRIKDWGAYENSGGGYTAWLAVEIWSGADPKNGNDFGFDVFIQDSPSNNAARTGVTFWSHENNGYRFNNREGTLDWGTVVLTGHTAGTNSDFARSDWMLTNPIRWAKGDAFVAGSLTVEGWWPITSTGAPAAYLINLPDTVASSWEPTTWTALQNAVDAGRAKLTIKDSWKRPHVDWSTGITQEEVRTLGQNVEAAIIGLKWADDILGATSQAADVDRLNTLPDPLKFKTDGNFGNGAVIPGITKGAIVQNAEDWALRQREIKALAALYEYGPIPDAPASHSVVIQSTPAVPAHWEHPGWWIVGGLPSLVDARLAAYTLSATYNYSGIEHASWDGTPATTIPGITAVPGSKSDSYAISLPTAAQKLANGIAADAAVPIVASFA